MHAKKAGLHGGSYCSLRWYVYSDSEGDKGGVGVARWVQGHSEPVAGVLEVPVEVRQLWDTQMCRGRHTDIFVM